MICNIVVLFTNDSEKLAKDLIHHFGKVSINAICLDNHAYHLSSIRRGTKAKIHVIFFSPDFLRFLETKPMDAYYICGRLKASSTVAVFCRGLTERNVLCYHMAPLTSFNNWCKFKVLERDSESEDGPFPEGLIKRIRDVVDQDDREPINIVIVPQVLNRQYNEIYLIFSKLIPDSISIHLNDSSEVEVKQERINPYVLKCRLPDSVFQFSHNISVSVLAKDRILVKQLLHVSQISDETTPTSNRENTHQPLTRKEQFIDAQLEFLASFSGIQSDEKGLKTIPGSPEHHNTIEESSYDARNDYVDPSLGHFCREYGLEELSVLISNENSCTIEEENLTMSFTEIHEKIDQNVSLRRGSICMLPEMDASNRMDSYLVEDTDILRLRCSSRSLSLPPTLVPVLRNSDPHYLNMMGSENHDIKPHQQLLIDMQNMYMENLLVDAEPDHPQRPQSRQLSSERYMSLTLGDKVPGNLRTLLKKGLSTSQQELLDLMQDFKEGECSMSNVEQQFQLWTEKHCMGKQTPDMRKTTHEKTRKTSAFALPWRKRRTTKQNSNPNKDYTKTNADKQDDKELPRKISNTSASSASSKTSDASAKTMSPREDLNSNDRNSIDPTTTFTGWVSTYSPTSTRGFCPLYPEKNPPPLPSRPPPLAPRGIPKPTPLPRSYQPANCAKEETKFSPNRYDRGVVYELKQDGKEPEYVNYSMISQMNGFNDHDEIFAPEKKFTESTSAAKEIPLNEDQGSDGYECLIKPAQRIGEGIPEIRIFRRSASLPSNLNKSGEFSSILDHSENLQVNGQNNQNSYSCEQCCSMVESLASNDVYMSLLDFKSNSPMDRKQPMSKGGLSDSQQELAELMYAFKRGEKTISQVEQQFQEWHSRHIGVPPEFLFGSSQEKFKHEKNRKQAVFGLPGLKNFILGKPKKKTSNDIRSPDLDLEMLNRTKKLSESSNSSQKRLSKTSFTSTSSGTSETNEMGRANKVNRKNSEAISGGPSVGPPFPKRPPPMPPVKSVESKSKSDISTDGTAHSPKPVPPPKPKFLFRQTSLDFTDTFVPVANNASAEAEAPSENSEDIARPSSPIYIIPNVHKAPRPGPKKSPDSKTSRNPKLPSKATEPFQTKTCIQPNRTAQETSPKTSVTKAPDLPPQTMELLKMANLLSFDDEVVSKFYIRRSKSFPNLGVLQLQNPPVYLQLLGSVESNLRKSNHVLNVNRYDNRLYFHRFRESRL